MTTQNECDYCDVPHTDKTYKNQARMPINGRVCAIDFCIHQIVAALNAGGIQTEASCCGHGTMKGCITLADGRSLIIIPTPESIEEWAEVVKL